jgi:flagellar biosynthesis/type III secretory pathway chaperone
MNTLLPKLIAALREELEQYGEMLARLDYQQQLVMHRQTADLFQSIADINAQAGVIADTRHAREEQQRQIARLLNLPETAGFSEIVPVLPPDYRPLVQALVQENNELLVRVQQRARQNHLLLSHAVELMKNIITAIFPSTSPTTYDAAGRLPGAQLPQHSLYETVG